MSPASARATTIGLGLVCCVGLTGCTNRDMGDLQRYVTETLASPPKPIEQLPALKPYERYLYQAAEKQLRDPFAPLVEQVRKLVTSASGGGLQQQKYNDEIAAHNQEELEAFELDSLRMVGTLQDPAELWGIIKDSIGTVHRVQVGNYIGRNYGKVLDIKEDHLELREITKDADGRWEERNASLALSEKP
ncbi:MAG: pilus assembly protein PilP [Gammaproteobacteria bacterium]|nr:pilus assembly protein PilP [Gammaproteobacteria bacterium]